VRASLLGTGSGDVFQLSSCLFAAAAGNDGSTQIALPVVRRADTSRELDGGRRRLIAPSSDRAGEMRVGPETTEGAARAAPQSLYGSCTSRVASPRRAAGACASRGSCRRGRRDVRQALVHLRGLVGTAPDQHDALAAQASLHGRPVDEARLDLLLDPDLAKARGWMVRADSLLRHARSRADAVDVENAVAIAVGAGPALSAANAAPNRTSTS
jgi:hypothetical protein